MIKTIACVMIWIKCRIGSARGETLTQILPYVQSLTNSSRKATIRARIDTTNSKDFIQTPSLEAVWIYPLRLQPQGIATSRKILAHNPQKKHQITPKKLFLPLLALTFAYFLSGCASNDRIIYVPTKCDVAPRAKPIKSQSLTQYLKEVLIYSEGLERDLDYCRGGNL